MVGYPCHTIMKNITKELSRRKIIENLAKNSNKIIMGEIEEWNEKAKELREKLDKVEEMVYLWIETLKMNKEKSKKEHP